MLHSLLIIVCRKATPTVAFTVSVHFWSTFELLMAEEHLCRVEAICSVECPNFYVQRIWPKVGFHRIPVDDQVGFFEQFLQFLWVPESLLALLVLGVNILVRHIVEDDNEGLGRSGSSDRHLVPAESGLALLEEGHHFSVANVAEAPAENHKVVCRIGLVLLH